VNLYCLDICKNSSFLNKKFDIIFSADTLEHVESPQGFFNFIKKHLKSEGVVLITYPNESKDKHHGITWFNDKEQLLEIIDKAGLRVDRLFEVRETVWHRIIREFLWDFPKSILYKKRKVLKLLRKLRASRLLNLIILKQMYLHFMQK